MSDFGRRRQARLRKEYLYRKGLEYKLAQIQSRKKKVVSLVENDKPLPGNIANIQQLVTSSEWDDAGPALAANLGDRAGGLLTDDIDDEYRHAGVDDPKIFLTTSHDPSSRLKMFAKEMKLILPNSERMNRGNLDLKSLISSAKSNGFTDAVILHETRGRPDHMVVSHLPNGPTAYFTLQDVKLRHDIPDTGTMSEAYPNLAFHNFTSRLGKRIMSVLKYLFPVPKDDSKRMMMFVNHTDWILFRHYVEEKGEGGKTIGVIEVGPQFTMQCHKIIRGTLEHEKGADVEFVLRPYLNTAHKKLLLSDEMPWQDEEEVQTEEIKRKENDIAK